MQNRMAQDQELTSLKRGLRALSLLTRERSVSVSEVARLLGLPRTTAERIMVTLERERYVYRDPQSKRYGLASKVLGLASAYSRDDRLAQIARPAMFAKTKQIGWPVALACALGDQMTLRVTTDPATSLGLHKRSVGVEIAMASCSSGIVHLAFLDEVERAAQIAILASSDDEAQRLSRDPVRLNHYMAQARHDGFFIGPDMGKERSVSVPIMVDDRCIAVLLMMYISRGMNYDDLVSRFVPELRVLAGQIALQFRGRESP